MKHFIHSLCVAFLVLLSSEINAQTNVICPINAGPDQSVCVPNCATLTGTYVPTNQTTGYTISTIPYAPDPFNAGTAVAVGDDQFSSVVNIGFTFCYYGNAYTQLCIGSNGNITFNIAQALAYDQWPIGAAMPTAADPTNTINGPWQDLYPPGGGTIKWAVYGNAPCRRFVASWNQVAMYSCTTTLCTQQITLYETTNIIENFIQSKGLCAGWNGGNAIQGVQNAAGTAAVITPGRNYPTQWSVVNDAKRWTPNGANTYTVGWYQGATLIAASATTVVCPTATTTYTFQETSTNCNGVPVTVSDQMIVTTSSLVLSGTSTNSTSCTFCNGTASVTVVSGTGPFTYAWAPSGGTGSTANGLCAGTYTCTVTGAGGCQGTQTFTITAPINPTSTQSSTNVTCNGGCNGTATITPAPAGAYTYLWSPSGQTTQTATALCAGTYTVTATNASGCTTTQTITITEPPLLTATQSQGTISCNGGTTTASVVASGGTPGYLYAWTPSGGNGPTSTPITAGNYTCTITDLNGCIITQTFTIAQPTAVLIQATQITTANCGQNDGSVTITVSGGNGPYTVLWPATGNNGLVESNLPPGQVCVYAYDANGCGDTLCVNVPNTPGAIVNITSFTNVTCFNACDGTAIATAAGGTGPYGFIWNNIPQNTLNDTVTNLCPGVYVVTMTDANGCTDTASVTITQPTKVTNTASGATTICIGQSANLTDLASGGTPAYYYSWTDGTNNWTTQNITVSPTVTTTYTVFVTDANGCISSTQTIVVTVNPPLTVQAMAGITVCSGTVVNLTAVGNGGNGNLTFTWTPINQTGTSVNTTVTSTTTYTVTITDGCGTPSDTSSVTVTVNPDPVVNISASTATSGCAPLCVDFVNNTPNTASIAWTFGGNLGSSTLNNPTFCFTTPGTYDVAATVTDNIGCVGSTTLSNMVTVWPLPNADFSAFPQPATLLNNAVSFTDLSTGAVSWIWSFGADDSASVLQNPTYPFQDTGVFNVQLIVTNQFGCQDSTTMPIYVHADYALFIPNTFTPNGDGRNDTFFPQGIGVNPDKFSMYIFDRWGNMIYKTESWPGGWDGTVQGTGRLCQVDTYVYKIIATDPEGSRKIYIGNVNLIR